jgi:hypothetical protein
VNESQLAERDSIELSGSTQAALAGKQAKVASL